MKPHSFLFLLLLGLSLTNCHSKHPGNSTTLPRICIDLDHLTPISAKELIADIQLIPLETTDSNLSGICYPLFTDDYYLMRDNTQQQVTIYGKDGKLKHQIAHQGANPEEYRYMTEIAYNPYSHQLMLVEMSGHLHEYDPSNGHFQKKYRIDSISPDIESIEPLNADTLLIVSSNKNTVYSFYSRSQNKVLKQFRDTVFHFHPFRFYRNGEDLFHFEWFSNIVWQVKELDMVPAYYLDLGKYNHPDKNYTSIFQLLYQNRHNDDKQSAILVEHFSFIINNIQENQDYLFLTLCQLNKTLEKSRNLTLIYNKQNQTAYLLDPQKEGLAWNDWGNRLTADAYINTLSCSSKEELNPALLDEKNRKIYDSLNENDNPIVIKYTLK